MFHCPQSQGCGRCAPAPSLGEVTEISGKCLPMDRPRLCIAKGKRTTSLDHQCRSAALMQILGVVMAKVALFVTISSVFRKYIGGIFGVRLSDCYSICASGLASSLTATLHICTSAHLHICTSAHLHICTLQRHYLMGSFRLTSSGGHWWLAKACAID